VDEGVFEYSGKDEEGIDDDDNDDEAEGEDSLEEQHYQGEEEVGNGSLHETFSKSPHLLHGMT